MRYGKEEQLTEETNNTSHKVDLNNLMKKVRDEEKKNKEN